MKKHMAIYLRLSQEKRESEDSLANHRIILTEFCEKHGWSYDLYEEVLSGSISELEDRPQLRKLLESIDIYDGLVCIEISRLSRNGYISELVYKYCYEYDKTIYTPTQVYNLRTSEGSNAFNTRTFIAKFEAQGIGERSKNNKKVLARQGFWISGAVPYGYRRNKDRRLIIFEPEAQAVKRIFELHNAGRGVTSIADTLNAEGYSPQRTKFWNSMTVRKILLNKVYIGTVVFKDLKKVKKQGKWTSETIEVIEVPNSHEAIIPLEEFNFAQLDRQDRRLRCKPSKTITTSLKDILFCAVCGYKSKFTRESNGSITIRSCNTRIHGVKCNNSGHSINQVEEVVLQKVLEYRDAIKKEIENLKDSNDLEAERQKKIRNIVNQISKIDGKLENLLELRLDNYISKEEFAEKKLELEQMKTHLLDTQRELQAQTIESVSDKYYSIIKLLEGIEHLDPKSQNTVLRKAIKRVEYWRVIPPETRQLSSNHPDKKNFLFEIEIEYIE